MNIRDEFNNLQLDFGYEPVGPSPAMRAKEGNSASMGEDKAYMEWLTELAAPVADLRGVRLEKIASIQLQLAQGTYKVSPAEVAAKFIEHLVWNRPRTS